MKFLYEIYVFSVIYDILYLIHGDRGSSSGKLFFMNCIPEFIIL